MTRVADCLHTDVVGISPEDASVVRLVSMLAIEADDEWLVGRAYISQKSMKLLDATPVPDDQITTKILRRSPSSSRPKAASFTDEMSAGLPHHVSRLD